MDQKEAEKEIKEIENRIIVLKLKVHGHEDISQELTDLEKKVALLKKEIC